MKMVFLEICGKEFLGRLKGGEENEYNIIMD